MKTELLQKFKKVIIIDDDLFEHYVYSRVIVNNNFSEITVAFSLASDALTYLQENHNMSELPQIIFLDLYMPYLSGFEFLEAYNKLPEAVKEKSKVFIVSSTISNEDITRVCNDPNVVSFQQKPITKEFLDGITVD
ncbi:response regulator [Flavobacterium sp. W22_SRS_FP1]|uniref:response regulator n=1 Tax=Flavobacterium sp. W22_SRS_FP1 TaxID=3240276 RepID=UPI003F908AED